MNANELADMLEEEHYYAAALMMRQQQAEIEALKERNLFLESIYRTIKVQER